jgi:hypothetical protein
MAPVKVVVLEEVQQRKHPVELRLEAQETRHLFHHHKEIMEGHLLLADLIMVLVVVAVLVPLELMGHLRLAGLVAQEQRLLFQDHQ